MCSFELSDFAEVEVLISSFFAGVAYLTGDIIELVVENDVVCVSLLADFELLFGSSSNVKICLLPMLQGFVEEAGDYNGRGRVRTAGGIGGPIRKEGIIIKSAT